MATTPEDISDLMKQVTIPDHASCQDKSRDQTILEEVTGDLIRVARQAIEKAEQAQVQTIHDDSSLEKSVAALNSLRRTTSELTAIILRVRDASEDHIVGCIFSLCGQTPSVQDLLLYFKSEIKLIVRQTLDRARDDENTLLRVLEECYDQTTSCSGILHHDQYLDSLEEAAYESPYDPDSESEEYYEHENRLAVDSSYAKAEHMRTEQRYEEKTRNERSINRAWIRFWSQALSQCSGGPTLFLPLASHDLENPPQYLFRTFDLKSSGSSGDIVVASPASDFQNPTSRKDLLSYGPKEACARLHSHLQKHCFSGESSDNLMSWSSSLLFVVQYAIWRSYNGGCSIADTKICAVDTTKFRRGQFGRDMWLIQMCHDTSNINSDMQNLIRLRQDYDNGEYLSQGIVNHKNRSCVVSLKTLIQAGLYKLYPEFDEPMGRRTWTNRVRDLRSMWAGNNSTSQREVDQAFQVARSCFINFQAFDLALMLLAFKNRRGFRENLMTGKLF